MTKVRVGLMLMGTLTAPVALAAQDAVAARVQGALDNRLMQPECKIDGGDFRVSSGKTYLKTGIEGSGDPINKVNALKNGARVITDAINTSGQGKSSGAWYWLARIYLQQGDLAGADTAFTRALALAPSCKDDIQKYRYRAWAALVNGAGSFRQAKQDDSAMVFYRAANRIYREAPLAFVNMADMFASANQSDSALAYFGRAAETQPTDEAQVKLRNQAAFNYSVLLLNAGRAPEAVVALRRYLMLQPDDVVAKKALTQAFRAAGMPDSAQALERELVAVAGAPGAGGGDDGLTESDLFELATRQYNDKNYSEAATTYARLLQRNPNHRDALYAQANSYLALQNGPGLIAAARKLVDIDPLGEYNYQLLAQGYKFERQQDKLAETILAQYALPVDLQFEGFESNAEGAALSAKAAGREARDGNNKLLPPHPVTITVEFLGKDGAVVASQSASIGALKPGESSPLQVKVKGAGIRAWRYKVG